MHYNKAQCARAAVDGELCGQHGKMAADNRYIDKLDWHPYMDGDGNG